LKTIIFFSGFEMPVSTNNNFPAVQATGKLPENAAGNTSVQTSGHSPDQDAVWSDCATGKLPENAAGNTSVQTSGNSPDQDAVLSDCATGKLPENAAGLSEEGAGLLEGTTSESRNLDQVICVNHFFIFSL
jgi:septal ring-binding cell division protein DamX